MAYIDYGNPAGYTRSSLWDTDWGKKAYGSYNGYTQRMANAGTSYRNGNNELSQFGRSLASNRASLGNQYGGYSKWASGVAGPNDPIVGQYEENIAGRQRNDIDDLVKRTAGAGVAASRGGFGVAGGPAADSLLRQGGMDTIARGASDRYDQALGYTNKLYGGLADAYSKSLDAELGAYSKAGDLGLGYAGAELQGIGGQNQMFGMRREDYTGDQAAQQAWQAGRQAREREQMTYEQQLRDAQSTRDTNLTNQNRLRYSTLGAAHDTASPWAGYNSVQEYLRQKGLITSQGGGGKRYNPSSLRSNRGA